MADALKQFAARLFFTIVYYVIYLCGSVVTLCGVFKSKISCCLNGRVTIPPVDNDILLTPAVELSIKIRSGKLKSEQVVKAFVDRIQAVNPILNAIIDERFEDALKDARQIDREIESELQKVTKVMSKVGITTVYDDKPLLGIPFTAKDSASISGMLCPVGLKCRKGIRSDKDCPAVAALRSAGAIPLAVTNVPELLLWWDVSNKVYGATLNPYDVAKIPGGSSGGEAALLASAGTVIGVASDIGGSTRIPAFMCGVFGHKTSPFIIPNDREFPPVPPERHCLLSYGPMTRYACDIIPMLKSMVPKEKLPNLRLDEPVDLSSLRIFYMEDDGGSSLAQPVSNEMRSTLRKCVEYLRDEFGVPVTRVNFDYIKYSLYLWGKAMISPSATPMNELMTNCQGKANIVLEAAKALIGQSDHTFEVLLIAAFEKFKSTPGGKEHRAALEMIDKLKQEFRDTLGSDGVFLYPPHPETAPYQGTTLFKAGNICYMSAFNILEVPATQVPLGLGKESGMPVGVQVASNPGNDRFTIAVACALEKRFGGWVPPFTV